MSIASFTSRRGTRRLRRFIALDPSTLKGDHKVLKGDRKVLKGDHKGRPYCSRREVCEDDTNAGLLPLRCDDIMPSPTVTRSSFA